MTKRLVILESPYAGDIKKNKAYARKAMKHSLMLGEAPMVSHLLYTQVLKDEDDHERHQGITAGWAWREAAECAVFYADLGFSKGMLEALRLYSAESVPVEIRYLYAPRRQRRGQGAPSDGSGTLTTTGPDTGPSGGFIPRPTGPKD